MSDSSCDCRQVYDLPCSEEEQHQVEEEGLSEESKKCSSAAIPEDEVLPSLREFAISPEDSNQLVFNELLFIRRRLDGKTVGNVRILVDSVGEELFSVGYWGRIAMQEGIHTINVVGLIRPNLQLVDQVKSVEHLNTLSGYTTTYILQTLYRPKDKSYRLKELHEKDGLQVYSGVSTASCEDFRHLLSASASFMFFRQVARKDFVGKKYLRYIHLNRVFCWEEYKCYPFDMVQMNNRFLRAKRIRRRLVMPNGELTECNIHLTERGQILLVTWPGENVYAAVDGRAAMDELHKDPIDNVPLRERIHDNPLLESVLAEERDWAVAGARRYVSDHPELRAVLSHISKTLLLYKPHKVVHFVRRNIAPYL